MDGWMDESMDGESLPCPAFQELQIHNSYDNSSKERQTIKPLWAKKNICDYFIKKNCMVTGLNESNRPAQDNGVERMYYFYL